MNFRSIGVLALQGAFEPHVQRYAEQGIAVSLVRSKEALRGLDLLILPGGESTTQAHLLRSFGLDTAIQDAYRSQNLHLFGTCAGAILLSQEDGAPPPRLGLLDITCQRNAYGSQVDSFTATIECPTLHISGLSVPFIRAPRITRVGEGVEVLARHGTDPILVRKGRVAAATFHAELVPSAPLIPTLVFATQESHAADHHFQWNRAF